MDHNCWERPEDMDTVRTVYAIDAPNPASDVAGETAAALAASSMAFKSVDPKYAKTLLQNAVRAFQFADKFRGAYSDNPNIRKGVCPFYCDFNGYHVSKSCNKTCKVQKLNLDFCLIFLFFCWLG